MSNVEVTSLSSLPGLARNEITLPSLERLGYCHSIPTIEK